MFSLASNLTDIPTAFTSNIQSQAEGYPRIYCLYRGIPASPAVGGFTYSAATLQYSVSALINRPNIVPTLGPLVNSKPLGLHIGTRYVALTKVRIVQLNLPSVVSTPFLYYPRSRPPAPLPRALTWTPTNGFCSLDEWSIYEAVSKTKQSRLQDIAVKIYIPKSRTFYFAQRIPFYFTIESSPVSLAAFLPFAPKFGPMSLKAATKIEVLRHTAVNVR